MSASSLLSSLFSSEESEEKAPESKPESSVAEEAALYRKNVYSDQDMSNLIKKVKDFTILPGLTEKDWNPAVYEVVQKFFEEPREEVLSVYFTDHQLSAILGFPSRPVYSLMYFTKKPTDVITPDNFHDVIEFGTASGSVEGTILNIVGNIFAPALFSAQGWPESVKSEFCSTIHDYLGSLTDLHYRMQGLTVLYVPHEGLNLSVEEASKDKDLLKRLEGVVVNWSHQIRQAVTDKGRESSELHTLQDEFQFLIYRYEDLASLEYQLNSRDIKHISNILNVVQSPYVQEISRLREIIERTMKETKSNIEYLQVLKDPCSELEAAATPKDIPLHIPKILHFLRAIWLNSPYFNTEEKISKMCSALSNQVILQCTQYLNLDLILEKTPNAGISVLKECIECCVKYKSLFYAISQVHAKNSEKVWRLDEAAIFNHLDSLHQRCQDLIEVCKEMIIFGRMDEMDTLPRIHFSGTRGDDFDRVFDGVEESFKKHLEEITRVKHSILDVKTVDWFEVILRFRSNMQELEVIILNLMDEVFESVQHVEEALNVLQAFYHYARRESIKQRFEKKITDTFKMFSDDIQEALTELVNEKETYPSSLPYYSGCALMATLKRKRLSRLMKLVDEAHWLGQREAREELIIRYTKLISAIEDRVKGLYRKWLDSVNEVVSLRLECPLMVRSIVRPGLLECNLDSKILDICREATYWEALEFGVPSNVETVYKKWDNIKFVYENVLQVVMDYNRIISSLSDEERALFKELIKICEKKINPGLVKLKWSSDVSDEYIAECAHHISELQSFIDDFKRVNVAVARICEKISDTSLVDIPHDTFQLSDLQKMIISHCEDVLLSIAEEYKVIVKNMAIIFEGFGDHIKLMVTHWAKYVYKMDKLVEEGLRLCVKGSLNTMYETLRGVKSSRHSPLIHVSVSLENNKITYSPSVSEISNMISAIRESLLKAIEAIPRLHGYLGIGKQYKPYYAIIAVDDECSNVQSLIRQELKTMKENVHNYTTSWEPFSPLWAVDKDVFISQYEKMDPPVSSFDEDISRYTEMSASVNMQDTVSNVSFLLVNAAHLKETMIDHCTEWRNKLSSLLVELTNRKLNAFLNYMKHNTKRMQIVPQSLEELRRRYQIHESLLQEVPIQEKQFPVLNERFAVIEKYEIPVSLEMEKNFSELEERWRQYLRSLDEEIQMLDDKKETFRVGLLDSVDELKSNAVKMLEEFRLNGPFSSDWKTEDALEYLARMRQLLNGALEEQEKLAEYLSTFGITVPPSTELQQLMNDLTAAEVVWELVSEWDNAWELYKTGGFWTIETQEMEQTAQTIFRKLTRLSRELQDKQWEILEFTRKRVDAFRRTLPLIGDLKNPAMRPRHWDRVKRAMDRDFDQDSPDFNMDAIVEMDMQAYAEEINSISNAATMELQIEMGLQQISDLWATVTLEMPAHKEKGLYRLVAVDDIFQALEDNIVQLAAMKSTRFVEPFVDQVEYWEKTLTTIAENLDMTLQVQKQYLYLENVFVGEDIRKQLPNETNQFDKIVVEWKDITSGMHKDRNALKATHRPGLFARLKNINNILELIMRALEEFLETKRHIFPRFYFISNDDLLEILAQSKRPENVQPHLKKCFDNINKLKIIKGQLSHKWEGVGMYSADTEYIEFTNPVILEGPVELWLCQVENMMRITLKDQLKACRVALRKHINKRDKWIKEWPGQMCITSSQIQWTTNCTRSLMYCKALESKKPLRKLRRRQNQVLSTFSEAIRGTLTSLQRAKIVALVTIEIHARDVIDKMYKTNCMDVSAFEWLSQLRFYWDRDIDDCIIRQTNTYFVYGYEYLGNSGRLVITPLTDRCYITLTTALHLHRGGSPKGPAGTGKTETTKDLGKSLGNYVIVINCSEGLDFKSMGRMFSGFAQTGAWGCFDEFNRINIEVLSVVAQQILSILNALQANLKKFIFEGNEIKLVHSCGLFITMNPGYAGRTELPDNLKSMFRPISMVVPDSAMIAEITLFGEGFRETRLLAKKVFTLYSLAVQQLSKQDHYDFGLRAMITLLRYAGRKRRAFPHLPDDEVILLAMKDSNDAKLTADDLPLFTAITSDLFPGIELPVVDYKEFAEAILAEFKENGLQPVPKSVTRVIQLYETKCSRHSVMIVGKTGSGKSVTWKMLKGALNKLAKEGKSNYNLVQEYPINPKALSLGELYGEYNLATNEWLDGVLSAIMRFTCADESPDEKWILFDGPVDAVWIENMNSVMDDNKVLTLINSERITMPSQVSLVFEVEDLAVASPATVSRCGMVYNDFRDLGWRPYVKSWIQKQEIPEIAEQMEKHFDNYMEKVLHFKHLHCKETVNVSEMCVTASICKLLTCLATKDNGLDPKKTDAEKFKSLAKMWFLFCMIWSVCATVDEDGRKKIDNYIRELEGVFPLKDTVYEYYVDPESCSFMSWESKLAAAWKFNKELPFFKIIVPTVDTARYNYLVSTLLEYNHPSLLVGPVGTGKTSTAYSVLDSLHHEKYSILIVNMSAQTTSNNVQDIIESRVEKRTREVYMPPRGKKLIAFLDDLNMPAKEIYGAQPPLELIRQWIDYGFWYDREKQTKRYVQQMLLLAAMGPPGGARQVITGRLLSCFNIINMTFPSESQITRIFGTMLAQQLADFEEEMKLMTSKITTATVELYNEVCAKMLPTPTKMHYLFNLRDISKVFQGLLRSHKDYQSTNAAFLRLWVHECFCVFSDRLVDEKDDEWFINAISDKLAFHFQVTFHNLCPEKESPIFGDFVNPFRIYEDLKIDVLQSHLLNQLKEYNNSPGTVRMDLVLFKDAIRHVCRIVRVISQPRGNMLLVGIGGSGRQSLSRLSGYICEYDTFQLDMSKVYRVQEFRDDLKNLYRLTGVDYRPTMFLFSDTQISDESFLEIVNNMLSSGEVPNLYKPEEFEEVRKQLLDAALKADILPTNEGIYGFLLDRVRTNLHIVVCMSPIGSEFRDRIRQYPALVNCTTIDWFREWPKEALLEVASRYLTDVDFLETITVVSEPGASEVEQQLEQERLRIAVADMFATIHSSVSACSKRMWEEMKRPNYVTPTNYLELVAGYKIMLQEKRESLASTANKLRGGLSKIDESREKIEVMSVDLAEAQREVAKIQQECEESLVVIVTRRRETDEQQKSVAVRSQRIGEEEIACKKLADIAQADLDEAMPILDAALKALDALSKKDLGEIRTYARPPARVLLVLEAVMILKGCEPTWAEAKRQLGDINFIKSLVELDKDNITDRTLKKINTYTSSEEFDPEKVGAVSFAAKSLCMWVIAMEKYCRVYRVVAPKQAKVDEAMALLREKQAILAEAKAKLVELSIVLEKLQKEYDEKMQNKEELSKKAEMLRLKLERAAQLVGGLADEKLRWEQTVEVLDGQFNLLPGDCLIATAFVSYAGPFVSEYRDKLIEMWIEKVKNLEVPYSHDFKVVSFLSDPTSIREWNIQGLPSDEFSTENGIIVTRCTRWPLLIDPQCQGMKWIKNMETKKDLQVIDLAEPEFMKTVEMAVQFGKPVLLQNILEEIDPALMPILNRAVVVHGGQSLIKLGDKMVQYNPHFRFFITTKMGNPHYSPEISTKTTMVNFAVKEQGLEAQLLGIVVRKEKPQLEEQKDSLVLSIAENKRTLQDLEDLLLRLLTETKGSLIDDLELLNTLQSSKATSVSVAEQLKNTEITEKEIDAAREGYRPCAKRASILFFVLNDMAKIDPMYQFSLDAYISLFMISIDKSQHSNVLEERINYLNDYHTYAVYRNTCRGLFEHHKLLFSFHMCMKILDGDGKVSHMEYNFLLQGGIVLDRENQMLNPCSAWLPAEMWDNITELDKVSGFHGVIAAFEQYPRDWHIWYTAKEPETMPFPGEWEDICTEFQRMLFVRSLRSDRIPFCITSFVVNVLGQRFVEPPILDVKAVVGDSTPYTPLIFVLSPGVDPTSSLATLAESMHMSERFKTLSLGQGQSPIATKMIKNGVVDGSWIFLANCHLSLSWMPELNKIVEQLQITKVHPDFRLWLSSSPHPDFPIAILQAGIKMTTEPPKGIKANLKRLYQLITEEKFSACQAQFKYKKLLFSLCFFHAVMLERKKFQQLGWNVIYSFNDSDFEVSENLLSIYLDEYPDTPWDSLKYLIAGINYGGHVTDDWDRRLLTTYINGYFNDDALNISMYKLSSLLTYYIPRDGSLQSYKDYISFLPTVDQPEAFGQHSNADIMSLISDTRMMFETLMSLQHRATVETGVSKEDKVMQLAADVLERLPKIIDYENTAKLIGTQKSPLQVVLLQEISRYNALLVEINSSLQLLQKGVKGLIVMSAYLEEIFTCIYEGRVPSQWLKAYPSMKALGSWTRDLLLRMEHFSHWALTLQPPLLFWLAAYTFPTGFLTAVLQTSARANNISIDSLSWDFVIVTLDEHLLVEPPDDGVYIEGMFLEGAGWDKKNSCLTEPLPMELVCPMPIIHFKPTEHLKKKTRGMYVCPTYYYPQRCGTAGRSAYVVAVDLKSGTENADHWIKRGTALLLSLAN